MTGPAITRIALALTCAALALAGCEPVNITSPTGSCIDGTNRCKDFGPSLPPPEPTVTVSVSGTVTLNGEPPVSLIRVEMLFSWIVGDRSRWTYADSVGGFSFNVAQPEERCGDPVLIRAGSGEPTIDIPADSVSLEACESYQDLEIHLVR